MRNSAERADGDRAPEAGSTLSGEVLILSGEAELQGLEFALAPLGDAVPVQWCGSGEGLLASLETHPTWVLIDLELPDDAVVFVGEVARRFPETALVVLAGSDQEELILSALRAGAHGYVVKDESGPAALRLTLFEAAEKVATDRRHRENEERYRMFFEYDITADFITTADGKIIDCNPVFVKLFGFQSREHALSCNTRWIYPDPEERADLMRLLKQRRRLEGIEVTLCCIDGTPVRVIENIIGHFDDDGELTGLQGFIFDITDRSILEQKLRHAQKMEVVGRLAGGIAHDFNNLLTVIQGNAQLLLMTDSATGAGSRGDLNQIAETARRAATLTRQLLAFSRKQVLQPRPINLSRHVVELEGMLKRLAGERVSVTTQLARDLWQVKADPGQVESIIINLIVNARDAMPGGGEALVETTNASIPEGDPTLVDARASATREHVPGDYVRISVHDGGTGIEPDTLPYIFEPFFTTKSATQGTGLGLATVLEIVESGHGFLSVDTEVGRGTTIHVFLPRTEPLDSADREREEANLDVNLVPGTETILVVDDEDGVRGYVKRVLERAGYSVFDVRNAEEAIAFLEGGELIDLLLSDTVMPGMNGLALAESARQARENLKVLLMSGYSEDPAVQAFAEAGGAFLGKPFAPAELTRRVRNILDDV